MLKIVLQGDYFSAIKKYQASGDDMCLRIPMIFASNHMLPDTEDTIGLAERFLVVKIDDDFKPFSSSEISNKPYAEMLRNEGKIFLLIHFYICSKGINNIFLGKIERWFHK